KPSKLISAIIAAESPPAPKSPAMARGLRGPDPPIWSEISACLLQLSTFGLLPQRCRNAVKPFDFSDELLKYQSPFSFVELKRSGGGLSLSPMPTAALPGCSSSLSPCFFLSVLTSFLIYAV